MKEDGIITIGRELGSGGREVGVKLAEKLNLAFYDKEIISEAADESQINKELMKSYDEQPVSGFLYSLSVNPGILVGKEYQPLEMRAYLAQVNIIKKNAMQGSCVIVGRSADYILAGYASLLRVFITADVEYRTSRLMKLYNCDEKVALSNIRKIDKERATFYNYHTNQKWGEARYYDLCINSSKIGIDECVELISEYSSYIP